MVSKKFSLNEVDWKKWAFDCFIFLVPTLLFFVSQVQEALPLIHIPVWAMPLVQYGLMQLTALLKKYVKGK